jgi:stage II sporulation protein D
MTSQTGPRWSRPLTRDTYPLTGRPRLGWNIIRSDRYRIEATADPVRIEGWGSGHNTGFCQAGATELGQQGKTAAQILGFYFPGSEIRRIDLFR